MKTSTEKTYPIYYVRVRWSEALSGSDVPPRWMDGLPEGRMWNGTGWHIMEKEDRPVEEIAAEITRDWWPQYAAKRLQPDDMTLTVELRERDTWCSGWFSHWTFDTGLSDTEVLSSFQDYVDRIQFSDRSESEIGGLLMGAQDYWRLCAHGPDGEQTPPPCRCKHCKAQGIVRIDH